MFVEQRIENTFYTQVRTSLHVSMCNIAIPNTYIYIYIYICVCMCLCERDADVKNFRFSTAISHWACSAPANCTQIYMNVRMYLYKCVYINIDESLPAYVCMCVFCARAGQRKSFRADSRSTQKVFHAKSN